MSGMQSAHQPKVGVGDVPTSDTDPCRMLVDLAETIRLFSIQDTDDLAQDSILRRILAITP